MISSGADAPRGRIVSRRFFDILIQCRPPHEKQWAPREGQILSSAPEGSSRGQDCRLTAVQALRPSRPWVKSDSIRNPQSLTPPDSFLTGRTPTKPASNNLADGLTDKNPQASAKPQNFVECVIMIPLSLSGVR